MSLVRSNPDGKAGFLVTDNRINVLLSRGMHGTYLVGNADTFCSITTTVMWRSVTNQLKAAGRFGCKLPLRCKHHPRDAMYAGNPEDFERLAKDGGCDRPCGYVRSCGHVCTRRWVLQAQVILLSPSPVDGDKHSRFQLIAYQPCCSIVSKCLANRPGSY